jgi:hypothetical protein
MYRCTCPHCQKVLKLRIEWAGKKGACPQCKNEVQFPAYQRPSSKSATTQQLLKNVAEVDEPSLDDGQAEQLALLLSQGTCIDYGMADQLLDGRALSPRQWRRIVNSADLREGMRHRLEQQLEGELPPSDGKDEPISLQAASETATPNAWKVLSRFLYYQRHGKCSACAMNPTGMECMYRDFELLLDARQVPESRAENWKALLHRFLGL